MAKATGIPADRLAQYERIVATLPGVERKGAAVPYTSRNGHMFSFLTKEGDLALRLPADSREAFLKKYKTKLCEQYGRVMQEYVVVPARLLKDTRQLKRHFEESLAYVGSLKPKATTRPSKKKVAKKKASKKKSAKKKPASKKRSTKKR